MRAYNASHRYFEGARDGAEFKIQRVLVRSSNGFLPQLKVSAAPDAGGARVRVSMHPPTGGMLFVLVWSIPFVVLFLIVLPVTITIEPLLFLGGMPGFVWILGAFLFQTEAAKAKQKLLEIFNGAIAAPPAKASASSWPNG